MIKHLVCTSLVLSLAVWCAGQRTASLQEYLSAHRYTIHQNEDSTVSFSGTGIPALLSEALKGKRMFVYGQGFSHMLHLNNSLHRAFATALVPLGLKDCFEESARSFIVIDNYFYRHTEIPASSFYNDRPAFYQLSFERERQAKAQASYQYLAMDFERPRSFYKAISLLASDLDASRKATFAKLAPYYHDTSYLSLSPTKFIRFYKEQQQSFIKDSAAFREVLGGGYNDFRYLLSDPDPSLYTGNRDKAMAGHLLQQARPIGNADLYFMSSGMAHSRPGVKDGMHRSLVHLLNEEPEFSDKIVIANLYCDNCIAIDGGANWQLGFMKGEVLKAFQQAAKDDIVLFDLSGLSSEYDYIKNDYGDMLVFARNQR